MRYRFETEVVRFFPLGLVTLLLVFVAGAVDASPLAYIPNGGMVSGIDIASGTITSNISLGDVDLLGIRIKPGSPQIAYVGSFPGDGSLTGEVFVLDLAANAVIGAIAINGAPREIAFTPDGHFAYVTEQLHDMVYTIDTASSTVVNPPIGVGGTPTDIVMTSDGATAYVVNNTGDSVSAIDVASGAVRATIPVGHHPNGIALSPSGDEAYVANQCATLSDCMLGSGSLSVIATATDVVVATIPMPYLHPQFVTVTPDGALALVSNTGSDNIAVVDVASRTVVGPPIDTGPGSAPAEMAVTPDGTQLVVANQAGFPNQAGSASIVDVATLQVTSTIPLGVHPAFVAVTIAPAVSASCGDGVVDLGEACDDGAANGSPSSCCTSACVRRPNGASCDNGDLVICSSADSCEAGVCAPGGGGDPDGDDLCTVDDNCPTSDNPDQSDIDGDNAGDVCDPADAALNVVQVKLRRDSSTTSDNGSVATKGDFLALSVAETVTASAGAGLRLQDGLSMLVQQTWQATECLMSTSGAVTCRSTSRSAKMKLLPIRSTPGQYRFTAKLRRLAISSPFSGPVRVTLTYGAGIDRVGSIAFCGSSNSGLKCPP